jgi:hypothetical protein
VKKKKNAVESRSGREKCDFIVGAAFELSPAMMIMGLASKNLFVTPKAEHLVNQQHGTIN